jgi:hypothetical protein
MNDFSHLKGEEDDEDSEEEQRSLLGNSQLQNDHANISSRQHRQKLLLDKMKRISDLIA